MATGKQGFTRAAVPQHSVCAQGEGAMQVHAPLAAMYIQAVPGLPARGQDPAVIPLSVPMMCANPTVPFLALHVSSRAAVQQQKPETVSVSPRPKAAGKHVCPHCRRDCLKPSVLEKHLRCHTGERPYPCTTCGISFKTQSNLYKHKRTQVHARLSSESEKGTFSSQESTESQRETCSSPSLDLPGEDEVAGSNSVAISTTTSVIGHAQASSTDGREGLETEWTLHRAATVTIDASPTHRQRESLSPAGQRVQYPEGLSQASPTQRESPTRVPPTPNRTPLQRQEALFPKLSRGKTQSHGSTDSGFSEGSEPNLTSSPGSTLHDHSMESLAECSMDLQEPGRSRTPSNVTEDDDKSKVSVQQKQKLEEHILKLISDNSALVDDKHLLNVRPRKTVLSKQGSIDLPMPYTYKDSFHFEMRNNKQQVSSSPKQDRRGTALYSSVPTQLSISLEHAPLTRSSSLPFSVGIRNSERTVSPGQGTNVPLSRRCSAGNICTFKSVDQHPSGHRLLVRQAAVDCLMGAEISHMERGSHSCLSSDGDCTDTTAESASKRCRRKKAQKFAYNKWYMYGGGTFKKLYDMETSSIPKSMTLSHSAEQTDGQGIQTNQQRESNATVSVCSAASLPPTVHALPPQTSSQLISSYVLLQNQLINQTAQPSQPGLANQNSTLSTELHNGTSCVKGIEEKSRGLEVQHSGFIPSERKKQKTEDDRSALVENTDSSTRQHGTLPAVSRQSNLSAHQLTNQPLHSVCRQGSLTSLPPPSHRQGSLTSLPPPSHRQVLYKRHSSPLFVASESGTSQCHPAASVASAVSVASIASAAPHAKPSFLPMYQLKIPCVTDGASDLTLRSSPSPNPSSSSHEAAQLGLHETNSPTRLHTQSATAATALGQEHQGTLTNVKSIISVAGTGQSITALGKGQELHQPNNYTAIISATPTLVTSTSHSKPANTPGQNPSTSHSIHSMPAGPVSSGLSQHCQRFTPLGQNQSVTVGTTHSTDSLLSLSSTPTKTSQINTVTMASVAENCPATSVGISKKPLDTHVSVCQTSTGSGTLWTSHAELPGATALPGGRAEDKMLLVNDSLQSFAQDTFYVRTADLQIVMQLISDEQLALIEPQIETQDYKLYGNHSVPHHGSETSQPDTGQSSVSQQTHKQCSDHTITKPHVSGGDTHSSTFSKVLDITPPSAAAPQQKNSGEIASDTQGRHPENVYLTKTGPNVVMSRLCSKPTQYASGPLDIRTNPLEQQHKSHQAGVVTSSYPEPSETPGKAPSTDKLTAKPGRGDQPHSSTAHGTAVHGSADHSSRNVSASALTESHRGGGGSTGGQSSPGAVHTHGVSLSRRLTTSTERAPTSFKEKVPFWPDIPVFSDTCQMGDCQPALTSTGQQKSCHLPTSMSTSVGEAAETKAEVVCVSGGLMLPPASLSPTVSNQREQLSATHPSQHEPGQLACTTSATESKNSSGRESDPVLCQHQSLNLTGRHDGGESKLSSETQGKEPRSPCQSPGHHSPHGESSTQRPAAMWSNGEQGKTLTVRPAHVTGAHVNPHRAASKGNPEERIRCGKATGETDQCSQDPCTGPWLGGSFQSSQLHWEAATGFQGWVSQEPKTGEEDKKRAGTTVSTEIKQTAVNTHPQLSQPVTNVTHSTSRPAQLDTASVPHNYTPTLCGETSLWHDDPALYQKEGVSLISSEQGELISQRRVKGADGVPLGSYTRFTSLPTGHHSACGCSSSDNAIQKEVQKETHVKNSTTQSPSRGPRSSEHKGDETTELSVSTQPCFTLSPSNAAICGAINITPEDPNTQCSNLTSSYATHSNLTCASTAHATPTESQASQCQLSGSYLEEGASSSSDDEGKLVIELE